MNQNKQFQKQILKWYDQFGRKNLPWQVEKPYFVWVSEIMLQQTQVKKVIDYFNAFIQRFPTLQHLSKAKTNDVLQMWSGLGYYNRAKNIHKTAQLCHDKYAGKLPLDLDALMELPGIGRTTAAAILSLSANLPHAILDGNVKRVISRVYKVSAVKISQLDKRLWQIVDELMPKNHCRNYNQALMDLGSMVCVRSKPKCGQCPLNNICQAYKCNEVDIYPQKKAKTKQLAVNLYVLLSIHNNKVLLQQRKNQGIWADLWFLPTFESKEELNNYEHKFITGNFEVTHILSHRILTINVTAVTQKLNNTIKGKWVDVKRLDKIPHPSALIKILNKNSA